MANLNRDAAIRLTWAQLLSQYGNYLVYGDTDDYNGDTEGYNDDTEGYNDTEDYSDEIEGYNDDAEDSNNDTEYYNDDTEGYSDTDDDNDDTEVYENDDDDYNDDYYNNYTLDGDDDYNGDYNYILDSGGNEVPILPEKEFPRTLYRVHYSESVTRYSHEEGFLANNQSFLGPVRLNEFHNHLNWRSRAPSRFISTFSDKSHAFAWARNWQQKHLYGWYFIMTINPHRSDKIYHMETVIDNSGVGIPFDCPIQRTQSDEYLFFRQIPEDRIVELFDPDMKGPWGSWSLAHELSVAPYRRVEESARAGRYMYSDDLLLSMRSLSIASASGW